MNAFYLKFVHDGEGGGDFVIANVPKSVKDAAGVECQVSSYSVNVEPTLPYYNATTPITILIADPTNITATVGTLTLELKHQMLALQPTDVPADSTDASVFVMKATFTNSRLSGSGRSKKECWIWHIRLNKSNSAPIQVPIGISYRVTQQTPDGYRFDENYSTITKTGETESAPFLSEGSATGIITEGTDVTVFHGKLCAELFGRV